MTVGLGNPEIRELWNLGIWDIVIGDEGYLGIRVLGRDAKTYDRANNVCVKNPISGKIFANFHAVLSRK